MYAHVLIPKILKKGIEIHAKEDHKGREYGSVTFAAPVEINGIRANMAVVVKETSKNRYKMHRLLTPDGKILKFVEKKEAVLPTGGGVTANSSLATPLSSTSKNIIAESTENGRGNIQRSDRDLAPTFYSHMANVIDAIKQNKLGANSVVNYLKGKGVKDEEIKWSGIEAFLEGKKSVS